jgi:hypothetical protein
MPKTHGMARVLNQAATPSGGQAYIGVNMLAGSVVSERDPAEGRCGRPSQRDHY